MILKESHMQKNGLSISQNVIWNSFGSLTYVAANWLITVLVVVLSNDYSASGDLAICMAVGNLIATVVLFKSRPVQVSDVTNIYSTGDYVGLKIFTSLFATAFCMLYSAATVPKSSLVPVCAYALFKICDSFVDVFHGVDQKNDRLDYVGISQIVRGVLILVAFVVGMTVFGSLTISIVLMTIVTVAVILFYDIPCASRLDSLIPRFKFRNLAALSKLCFPGFIASLLCTYVVSYVRQEYGVMCGSELLGIYAAVATPAAIVQALASYAYAPLFGPIARAWASNNMRLVSTYIIKFYALLILISLGSMVAFGLIGEKALLLVFGPSVSGYAYLMPLVLLSTTMTASMLFIVDLLVVIGGYRATCIVSLLALANCLICTQPLLMHFGMNGISLVILLSYALGTFVGLTVIISLIRSH